MSAVIFGEQRDFDLTPDMMEGIRKVSTSVEADLRNAGAEGTALANSVIEDVYDQFYQREGGETHEPNH